VNGTLEGIDSEETQERRAGVNDKDTRSRQGKWIATSR